MARMVFGEFELDPASGDLRRGSESVRLQEQPLKLLLCLLDHPGKLVDREELKQKVWGDGIHVDFDDGINAAAWRLRQALGDSAEAPRYIETVPRKGYRLVCKVRPVIGHPPLPSESFPIPVHRIDSGRLVPPPSSRGRPRGRWLLLAGLALFGGVGAAVFVLGRAPARRVVVLPIRNGTGDPTLDYLADGVGRELEEDLRATSGFEVLSMRSLKGTEVDLRKVAKDAGAQVVIESTLLRDHETFQIPVALISAKGESLGGEVLSVPQTEARTIHLRVSAVVTRKLAERRP